MIVYALLFNFLYYVEISEVPSFGIMLLELITGRFAVDITQCSQLVDWDVYLYDEMTRIIPSAAAYIHHSVRLRPRISQPKMLHRIWNYSKCWESTCKFKEQFVSH
ncbi:proline-rich receptor-like protein kinase PERK1 isoform X2 [Mercurialis annua]|uniref:proline-rich receptor-like protein kinase PERK1 isoform X2 n=1 Tax=Mercurialis annua TaxID=3986 RepID=UPI002160BF9F|nr:proline-rich receptor-like protein kinase PERK1 isoform X2 [Mercurialis annua]